MISFPALLGIALVLAALAGGAYASYENIRAARGPRERRFVVRACAIGWLLMLSMLVLIYVSPSPYRYLIALAYFIAAPILIYRWSRTHQLIRALDAREKNAAR
jgi:hypothetical protein